MPPKSRSTSDNKNHKIEIFWHHRSLCQLKESTAMMMKYSFMLNNAQNGCN